MSTSTVPPLFNNPLFDQALFGGAAPGSSTVSAGGLIYAALRKAAVTLGPGRTPSPAQMQDALDELRRLTLSLNTDRLFIYSHYTITATLNGGKTYTIGISDDPAVIADIAEPRPLLIEAANIVSNSAPTSRWPVAILTDLQWAKITVQDVPNSIPQTLYLDRAYPIGTIYLWGQPISGYLLELYCWRQVQTYQTAADAVVLPPGYEDALVLNLACRLAPHFQRQVHPDVRQQARESLMRLESINAPQPIADTGALGGSCGGRYNIYSDTKR